MKKRYLSVLFAVGMLFFGLSCAHAEKMVKMVQIKGSDTLINLVQKLSEVYMKKNPRRYIAVTGGGSGTGIAALINGKCDIADASRLMKAKEVAQARERGIKPTRIVIAMDGISVIVNPRNAVDSLTMGELSKIFRGEIRNWKDLGGADMPITLYGRQSNSGTFAFFREAVLKGNYSPNMRRMNGNAQIVEAIKQDMSGIGYVGVGYARGAGDSLSIVKVASRAGGEYISPLDSRAVKSGKYPIARPLNQYTNGLPQGTARDFILFELSGQGQQIVGQEGFFPIPGEYRKFNKKGAGLE